MNLVEISSVNSQDSTTKRKKELDSSLITVKKVLNNNDLIKSDDDGPIYVNNPDNKMPDCTDDNDDLDLLLGQPIQMVQSVDSDHPDMSSVKSLASAGEKSHCNISLENIKSISELSHQTPNFTRSLQSVPLAPLFGTSVTSWNSNSSYPNLFKTFSFSSSQNNSTSSNLNNAPNTLADHSISPAANISPSSGQFSNTANTTINWNINMDINRNNNNDNNINSASIATTQILNKSLPYLLTTTSMESTLQTPQLKLDGTISSKISANTNSNFKQYKNPLEQINNDGKIAFLDTTNKYKILNTILKESVITQLDKNNSKNNQANINKINDKLSSQVNINTGTTQQINGEEDEVILIELKAKGYILNKSEDNKSNEYKEFGSGILRINKYKNDLIPGTNQSKHRLIFRRCDESGIGFQLLVNTQLTHICKVSRRLDKSFILLTIEKSDVNTYLFRCESSESVKRVIDILKTICCYEEGPSCDGKPDNPALGDS